MVKRKKYYSKSPARMSDEQAQSYGEELERIKETEGVLNPKNIIAHASKPRNPLHKYFDWDRETAANKWLHQQAIDLVGTVAQVVVIEGKRTKQRSFFGIKGGRGGVSYVTIEEVRVNKDYREKLIDDINSRLESTKDLLLMLKRY